MPTCPPSLSFPYSVSSSLSFPALGVISLRFPLSPLSTAPFQCHTNSTGTNSDQFLAITIPNQYQPCQISHYFLCPQLNETVSLRGYICTTHLLIFPQNWITAPSTSLLSAVKFCWRTDKYQQDDSTSNHCVSGQELENSQGLTEPTKKGPSWPRLPPSWKDRDQMPLRLNVAAAVLKLPGGQDRALYLSIANATDRHVM